VTRNLYSDGHRRSDPEAVTQQGWTGPSRASSIRHRSGPQRRGPLTATDERPSENQDTEAEQRQKADLKRLREEVLDIARELQGLRRSETGRAGTAEFEAKPVRREAPRETAAKAKPSGMSRNSKFAHGMAPKRRAPFSVDEGRDPAPVFGGQPREFGRRPAETRPPASGGKRPPPIPPATKALPARAAASPPPIHPGAPLRHTPAKPKAPAKRASRSLSLSLGAKAALLALLMLTGTGLITMKLWGEMPWLAPARQKMADMMVQVSWPVSKINAIQQADSDVTASIGRAASTFPFQAPDTYGVYAVSDGQLTPLEPLPIRVPDARVSISSTISKPAPAPVANGRLSFVVYHRELATSVPESASLRIVAKVMQATAFAAGKPKSMAVEDTWAVRGGAIDLRIAPVAANREMIVIRPADPDFTLSPGRYVLMFKNQAYDFSVAGTVSDTAQCLERSDLQDRSVYSECRELPAPAASF
jgi:hypothetical protein